jgi:hypothetical protein
MRLAPSSGSRCFALSSSHAFFVQSVQASLKHWVSSGNCSLHLHISTFVSTSLADKSSLTDCGLGAFLLRTSNIQLCRATAFPSQVSNADPTFLLRPSAFYSAKSGPSLSPLSSSNTNSALRLRQDLRYRQLDVNVWKELGVTIHGD